MSDIDFEQKLDDEVDDLAEILDDFHFDEVDEEKVELDEEKRVEYVIRIQTYFRMKRIQRKLSCIKDGMSFVMVNQMLDAYINYSTALRGVNTILNGQNINVLNDGGIDGKKKKCRMPNFPSEISENIVKFALIKRYKIAPTWNTKSGDLCMNLLTFLRRLEIKCFISNGPASFGPNEKWDYLYFVDACDFANKIFKIYEIRLANDSPTFQAIRINSNQTYGQQCLQKRRPRIKFSNLRTQLGEQHCRLIFEGHLDELT